MNIFQFKKSIKTAEVKSSDQLLAAV